MVLGWSKVLADNFRFTLPLTPYRSYDPADIVGHRRVLFGVEGMISDVKSLTVRLTSISLNYTTKWCLAHAAQYRYFVFCLFGLTQPFVFKVHMIFSRCTLLVRSFQACLVYLCVFLFSFIVFIVAVSDLQVLVFIFDRFLTILLLLKIMIISERTMHTINSTIVFVFFVFFATVLSPYQRIKTDDERTRYCPIYSLRYSICLPNYLPKSNHLKKTTYFCANAHTR